MCVRALRPSCKDPSSRSACSYKQASNHYLLAPNGRSLHLGSLPSGGLHRWCEPGSTTKGTNHALEIVLDEIYYYWPFFFEKEVKQDLTWPLFGWLIYWAGCWSARQVADLADPMLPAAQAHARGTVLPASQPNKQLDSCIVQCYIWTSIYENDLIKDVPQKCCTS